MKSVLPVLAGLAVITLLVSQIDTIRQFLTRAKGEPANLVIDTQSLIGPLPRPWRNLAQGGEAADWQITPLQTKLAALKPEYIRIDHLYDFYISVSGNSGNLTFDWSKLDLLLRQISGLGAKPFISLSYMPPAISTGDITDTPRNWPDWSLVVQRTIEHISGTAGLNLPDVTAYLEDVGGLNLVLEQYPQFFNIEKIITEAGHNSQNDRGFDTMYSAAHTLSLSRSLTGLVDRIFTFEIQDGKDPAGQASWGRWGLFTHPDFGATPKPRYDALAFLERLSSNRLAVIGEGTWVKALAATIPDTQATQVLVINYDPSAKHTELVPVTFTGLTGQSNR